MARKNRKGGAKKSTAQWTAAGAIALALLVAWLAVAASSNRHPEPRAGVDHSHVVPAERYATFPRVASTYAKVAEVPQVIDGIYCYCACSEHSGHYSPLDCFHDDHGAYCDICLSQADIAHRMHRAEGKSLDEIRKAIDRLYRT